MPLSLSVSRSPSLGVNMPLQFNLSSADTTSSKEKFLVIVEFFLLSVLKKRKNARWGNEKPV